MEAVRTSGRLRWVTASAGEVPAGDAWLGPHERAHLATLEGARRREDWRLGRWAAKGLVGRDVEILPAPDGAPTAPGVHLSIAHRRGRALAAVSDRAVGCDLEPLRDDRDVVPFVALEAAAKALRRGLLDGDPPRIDLRDGLFVVAWPGQVVRGRWWLDGAWALAVGEPG